jgi:predicted amidohydrolase YtcJ
VVAGTRLDCRIRDGRIVELAPGLPTVDGERSIDGAGGALLPGLADHHLHLRAAAAAARSIDLAGSGLDAELDAVPDAVPDVSGSGWLRVIGAGVTLTRAELDPIWPARPVRVQHRSGALWTLNSAALALLRDGATALELATGQFWRSSARLRFLLPPRTDADVDGAGRLLASYGVTHVTDATPDADPAELTAAQHVLSLAEHGDGARKIVIADHDLPNLDALTSAIRTARPTCATARHTSAPCCGAMPACAEPVSGWP